MNKLSHCTSAEILLPVTKQVLKARVSSGPLDSLLVTVPLSFKPSQDQPITISFLDPALGVVTCRCVLTAPLISDDRKTCSYRCRVLEELSQEQRREDIKLSLSSRTEVTLLSSGMSAPAVIQNISAGGVYLVTTLAAQKGDRLSFQFQETTPPVPVLAEILRAEGRMDQRGDLVRGYGCRFIHLGPQQEARLRSYVFKEDRRQFKRKDDD